MQDAWLTQAREVGIWCFYLATAVTVVWEAVAPRRALSMSLRLRWLNNIGLFAFNMLLVRLIGPVLAVSLAFWLQASGVGLFNAFAFPDWIAIPVSFVFLDFCFYLKHRLAHRIPWLWRVHRVHHSDADIDITTGLRFHPLDVAYQLALQLLAVLVIGAPPIAAAAHIIVFNVVARLQHGNVYLPEGLDRILRYFVVTSDMHRIHHSARKSETDSNYGGVLPWYDRLLGTYVEKPVGGHLGMTVGLHEFSQPRHMTLGWMLINPLLTAGVEEPLPGRPDEPLPQATSSARPS